MRITIVWFFIMLVIRGFMKIALQKHYYAHLKLTRFGIIDGFFVY